MTRRDVRVQWEQDARYKKLNGRNERRVLYFSCTSPTPTIRVLEPNFL